MTLSVIKTWIGLGVMLVPVGAWAQQSEQIASPRPLRDLADRLQAAWARPVTYEEPVWQHASDASLEGDPLGRNAGSRVRVASMPAAAMANRVRAEDITYLREIVAAFSRSNAPLAFAVTETDWGLHIVPSRSRNAGGADAPAINVLDEFVALAPVIREPFRHLEALAKAISDKGGVRVEAATGMMGFGFDRAFASADSGTAIEWGTAGVVKARDALISLLGRSATTMSWRLNCQPASVEGPPFCVLGVDPLQVERVGRDGKTAKTVLQWDRCVRCPPLGPPPAPP